MADQRDGRIAVHVDSAVATVLLENPAQRNALTKDMCLQLVGALASLASDEQVKLILLRGAQGHFSAGIAIDQMDRVLFDADDQGTLVNHFDLVDQTLRDCPQTTIAVVQGNCFGGAWQLAAACDIQLTSDDVQIAITPAKIGLVFPRFGIERLVSAVGESRAKYLLFSGAKLSASQAESWGLFTKVVPSVDLESELEDLGGQILGNSPYALRRMNEAVNNIDALGKGLDADHWWEQLWEENAINPDLTEGRKAFYEHRKPEFG